MNEIRNLRRATMWSLACLLAVSAGLASSPRAALAQAEATPAPEQYLREHPMMRRLVAERIARLPMLRLRTTAAPTPNEYKLTALAIEVALGLDPTTTGLARRAVEAWHASGDSKQAIRATKRLYELEPTDTVAQLRIISDRISDFQSVEDRLAAYETLLGPDGEGIDASVRSRLALDAALLAQEQGDDARFVRLLTRSTQLDTTNKDAAVLAATYFHERSSDPLGRVEMLINVLLADPIDPSTHMNLARELRSYGAFVAAQRFYDNATRIYARANMPPSLELQIEALVGLWQAYGADTVLQAISGVENQMRQQRAYEIAVAQAQGRDAGPPLEETRLPPELEAVRMAISLSLGRQGAAEASIRSIAASADILTAMINGAEGQGLDPEVIADARRRLRSETLWLRLWSGSQIDLAAATLDTLIAENDLTDMARDRYMGLLAMHRGELDAARGLLTPLADRDPRSRLGLGLLAEREGRTDDALRHYAVVALDQPQALLGAYARRRIELMTGAPLAPTETAQALEAYIADTPTWIDEMTQEPRNWMHLAVEPARERVGPLSPLELDVTLRNIGRLPLAVGPGRPIDTRVLLAPSMLVDGQYQAPNLQVEIADLERRLRLLPGESLKARIWAGQGWLGQALDGLSDRSLTMRWRAVQGYRMDNTGKYLGGAMGLTAEVPIIAQAGVSSLGTTADGMAKGFADAQGQSLIEALFFIRAALQRAKEDSANPDSQIIFSTLDKAVADRMPSMTELERALATLVVGAAYTRAETAGLDAIASTDASPLVRMAYLLARVPDPENPVYDTFANAPDPNMAQFAALLRAGLRTAEAAGEVSPLERDIAPTTIVK